MILIHTFNEILNEPKRNKKLTQILFSFFQCNLAEMNGNFGTSLSFRKQIAVINIQETLKYELQ